MPFVGEESYHLVFDVSGMKMKLTGLLMLEPVGLPPCSIFARYGYLRPSGAEYLYHQNVRYGRMVF